MNRHKKITLWVFLFFLNSIAAQQLRFKHITSEDGLSTNYITCIMQDELGFMWFGSQDGLNKYNGYADRIKIFKHDPTDENSLSNSEVTAVLQVRKDLILVGTREGLNSFNTYTEKFTHIARPEGKINVIYRLDSMSVLVGTEEGLFEISLADNSIKTSFFKAGDKANVSCIETVKGTTYFGTNGRGLWRIRGKSVNRVDFVMPDLFKIGPEELLAITHIGQYSGKMYVGTYGHGIFKIDARDFEIEKKIFIENQNEKNFIKNFSIKNNKIYAASKLGVNVYNLIGDRKSVV